MKKHIIVITTGGTIAMKTDPVTGGLVPAVSGEDLAAAVPGLSSWADVDVVEFSNVPSGWIPRRCCPLPAPSTGSQTRRMVSS